MLRPLPPLRQQAYPPSKRFSRHAEVETTARRTTRAFLATPLLLDFPLPSALRNKVTTFSSGNHGFTVNEKFFDAESRGLLLSLTVTVMVNEPATVGVPYRAPVVAFICIPLG